MAFDEQTKNYNLFLKKTPPATLLDLAIMQSLHVMVGGKAAKGMWGLHNPRKNGMIRGTTLETDIIELEKLLASCNLFVTHNHTKMNKDFLGR